MSRCHTGSEDKRKESIHVPYGPKFFPYVFDPRMVLSMDVESGYRGTIIHDDVYGFREKEAKFLKT